jgi:hypothetical protein
MSIVNIKPFFWGPKLWCIIYSIAAVYPDKPDIDHINSTMNYLISLKDLLPCKRCRTSYEVYIKEEDTNILDKENYISRKNFIMMIYNLREKVNKKLGLSYYISLNYFTNKLNKMICDIKDNNIDYYLNNLCEVPFIPKELETEVFNYIRNNSYDSMITKKIIKKLKRFIDNPIFNIDNLLFRLFLIRNMECRKIINTIYYNISKGDYKMYDSFTIDKELHLILFYYGCSIICNVELEILLKNIV